MSPSTGMTQAIFELLDREDDSLTARQINERLIGKGISTGGSTQVSALLRYGEQADRFVRTEIKGQLHWTNNPEWGKKPAKSAASKPPKPTAPVSVPAPMQQPSIDAEGFVEVTPVAPAKSTAATAPRVPEPAPVAAAAELMREVKGINAPAVAKATPSDGYFGEQLDAIASDIEQLVVQACDRQLPHRLIRHLVTAQGEVLRALGGGRREQKPWHPFT